MLCQVKNTSIWLYCSLKLHRLFLCFYEIKLIIDYFFLAEPILPLAQNLVCVKVKTKLDAHTIALSTYVEMEVEKFGQIIIRIYLLVGLYWKS